MAKKRKVSVRRILQVFLTLVVTTACIIAMAGAAKIDDNTTLKNIEIHIRNDKKYHFIEEKEIMDLAINNRNVDIARTPLSKLDIHSMEKIIKSDPWVADAQVFVDNGRVLHMYVTQRIPVARLFQKNSVSYYMDTTMSIMPLSNKNIYYTTVVTNMPELKNDSSSWAIRQQVVSLVRTIEADSFWNTQISQVIVDSSGMFELLPVLGNQTILFGDASRMRDKFNNLFSFYKNVLNRIGWDKYETLDVRFNGQVVASPSLPYKGPVDKAVVNMNWINSIVESEAKEDEIDSMHGTGPKESHTAQKTTQAKPIPLALKQNKDVKANPVQKKGAITSVKTTIPIKQITTAAKQKETAKPTQKHVVNAVSKKDIKKADKKKQTDKLKKNKTESGKKDKTKNTDKENIKKQTSPKYVYPEKKRSLTSFKSQRNMSNKEQPIIVGLDIGTTKVVAIAGRKNEFGKVEILGLGRADSAGVSHGVVMNIEQCIRSIEQAIERCIQSNPNLEIREVYVGIAGQHIKSLQTRGDRVRTNTETEIGKDDIELLVRDQYKTYIPAGDQIIDIIPQDFTVDSTTCVVDPIGMSGVKIGANFHIITGDRNAIRNIKRCVDKSKLITRDLVLQPLASAAAVMNDEDLEAGVAIVDIGGGTTDMAVFYDGILKHTAVIPYAGVNITNDIRNGLGVLRAQAEQMKVQFGTALAEEANNNAYITIPGLRGLPPKEISVKNLAHIIQARMQEILDYVVYHLKQIDLDKRLYGGIILTGGGAQLKHITQLTEFITGLGARIGYPNEHLAGGHAESLMNPMYSTCIGLILRGYHDFENGRMRFAGEGGNYMHLTTEEIQPLVSETVQPETNESQASLEEQAEMNRQKARKRNENVKRLFDGLKGKFMKMFEDVEDQEIG